MKSLGKIFFILFFMPIVIYASVVSSVNYKSVSKGETVVFSLKISGNDIQRPIINRICESDVISTSSQTSIEIINGDYKKSYILSYKFMPQKSCEIKPVDIEVDGKIQTSQAIKIEVKPRSQDKNADFILSLSSDKKEMYVGEPFELTLLFKKKRSAEALDSKFVPPSMKGFWIKGESDPDRREDGEYTVTTLRYIIAPQREGVLTIAPAQMSIATRSSSRDIWTSFAPQVKWETYFSNELNISAKPIPMGQSLVGEFTISAQADKTQINPNEAVNIELQINGRGNLEDIKSFKPYIEGVSVFEEKIVINGFQLTQKLAMVGDSDFVVPPFELTFFNPKTKKVQTIATQEIKISVRGQKGDSALKIKREEEMERKSSLTEIQAPQSMSLNPFLVFFIFILGVAFGVVLMILKPWEIIRREKGINLKDDKKLLVKLLPFKEDKEVQKVLDILENNIYSKEKKSIDKKLLKELLRKYDIR